MSFSWEGKECKCRKSRNTWSNRKNLPWNVEWNRAKTNRVLPRICTSHSKHPLPTTQENSLHMDITRWSTPKSDWLYFLQPQVEKLYTVNKNETRSWCGSDHELLIAKFRLKLKKVDKTTRPFRYDLNENEHRILIFCMHSIIFWHLKLLWGKLYGLEWY